jgi:hypothetical protein
MRSVLLLSLLLCGVANAEIRLGLGAALNNSDPKREEVKSEGCYPGQLVDLGIVFEDVTKGIDAQLAWTYVMESDFGTEQAVTLTFLKQFGPVEIGAGLMLGYTQGYETWQREYLNSPSYDAANPVGPRECIFCGAVAQVGYTYKSVQLQIRYWRTDFNLYPGHNGPLAVVVWRL